MADHQFGNVNILNIHPSFLIILFKLYKVLNDKVVLFYSISLFFLEIRPENCNL